MVRREECVSRKAARFLVWLAASFLSGLVLIEMNAAPVRAQSAGSPGISVSAGTGAGATAASAPAPALALRLWTDPTTGQVFTRPGPGRVPLQLPFATQQSQQAVVQQVQQQVQQTQAQTADLSKQVQEIKPAWEDYVRNFKNKVAVGGQFWADYAYYPRTSYAPQLLTLINPPGPGNDNYNTVDITRAYINVFWFPTPDWTLRITPNIFRALGPTANQSMGAAGAMGNTNVGDMSYRLKYGYVIGKLFADNPNIGDDVLVIGQQPEPLVPWEEDLYGYRFVNLVTWNMSIASTFPGISFQGPIRWGPQHLQYIDYNIGFFDEGSFHAINYGPVSQEGMARVTFYPFGARWRFDGLGVTTFYDFGYGDTTPDLFNAPALLKGGNAEIERFAEILHYDTETWGLAFEFDWGRNAWSTGNAFSGTGPAESFGLTPTNLPPSLIEQQLNTSTLYAALLNNGRAYQEGYNMFGHYHIANTPFTLFGWVEDWQPNYKVPVNPLDFIRLIAGIGYQYNEYLRFALDYQTIMYYHKQFNFPVTEAQKFNYVAPKGFTGSSIPNVVMPNMQTVMLNVEYAF